MANRFRQAGVQVYFQIEVGVDIQQARHQPLATAVDHLAGQLRREHRTLGDDFTTLDRDIHVLGRQPAPVKHQRSLDQGVPNRFGHVSTLLCSRPPGGECANLPGDCAPI